MSFEHDPAEPLPLFLLNTVLFPLGRLPLRVFEARYTDMTRDCLRRRRPFGVCLIREGREVGAPAAHEAVGCLASITECDMQQLGLLQLDTLGGQRFRVKQTSVNGQGLVSAMVDLLPEEEDFAVPEELGACAEVLRRIIAEHGEDIFAAPHRLDSATWVGHRLSEILPIPLPGKQKLLEMNDSLGRLAVLQRLMARQSGQS
jgi:Lon protease-like protein